MYVLVDCKNPLFQWLGIKEMLDTCMEMHGLRWDVGLGMGIGQSQWHRGDDDDFKQ